MKRFPKFLKVEMQVPCLEEQNSKKGVTLWHFNTKKMLIHAVTNYIVTLKQASDLHWDLAFPLEKWFWVFALCISKDPNACFFVNCPICFD